MKEMVEKLEGESPFFCALFFSGGGLTQREEGGHNTHTKGVLTKVSAKGLCKKKNEKTNVRVSPHK